MVETDKITNECEFLVYTAHRKGPLSTSPKSATDQVRPRKRENDTPHPQRSEWKPLQPL